MGLDMSLVCPDGYEMTWSKRAHMVHHWFSDRIVREGKGLYEPYEGEPCDFEGRELVPLMELCRRVMEEPEAAPDLMPTTYVYDTQTQRADSRTPAEQRREPGRYVYPKEYFDEIRRTLEFLEWATGAYAPDAIFSYWASC